MKDAVETLKLPSETSRPRDRRSVIASSMYSIAFKLNLARIGNGSMDAASQCENCFARSMTSRVDGS